MTDHLSKLKIAKEALSDAIIAIESIGWTPIPDAPNYEYNGREIRHKMKDGRYKPIKLVQNRFYAAGKNWYVSAEGQIKNCK